MTRSNIRWVKLMFVMRSSGISAPLRAITPVRYTTRWFVTTKYVRAHERYLSPSHTAHATTNATTTQLAPVLNQPPSRFSRRITTISSGIPVRIWRPKYHQCGRRSSASSSFRLSSFVGYGMTETLGLRPTEFAEAMVVEPEVVADLVEHRDPHLRREVGGVARACAQRAAEDRDAIGHHTRVAHRSALRERHPFVQTEQSRTTRWPVLHHHRDVLDLAPELGRDVVERRRDEGLEVLFGHLVAHRKILLDRMCARP